MEKKEITEEAKDTGADKTEKGRNPLKKPKKSSMKYMLIGAVVGLALYGGIMGGADREKASMGYGEFLQAMQTGKVETLVIPEDTKFLKVVFKEGMGLEESVNGGKEKEPALDDDGRRVETVINPRTETFIENVARQGVEVEYESGGAMSKLLVNMLLSVLQIGLMVLVVSYVFRKFMTPNVGEMDEKPLPEITTKFEDVAGMTEEKEELFFAIDGLKNPHKYSSKGVQPVKGILLEGPPGVGKTLIAKAIAGEAGVNFLSYSGSDFVEMFVGLGAQRIRKMYKKAEEMAPCVVFIDEIDAIGKSRGGAAGANAESDQTLLALLDRMDGLKSGKGILFIGATNRKASLDSALVRPGRFDKIIHVGPPRTKEDREAVVSVHLKNKNLEEGLTVEDAAKFCYGLTGAEIATVINDSVIESIRGEREGVIGRKDLDSAAMKLFSSGVAKGKHLEKDVKRVAVHELGHAYMHKRQGHKVVKVSIQPYSGGIGGVTMVDGESAYSDLPTRSEMREQIKCLYAGKAAEELFFGECSVGASNDLERATNILKDYVGTYGMGKGILSYTGLAKENIFVSADKELIRAMEDVGLEIYKEVEGEIREMKKDIEEKISELMEMETIYEI